MDYNLRQCRCLMTGYPEEIYLKNLIQIVVSFSQEFYNHKKQKITKQSKSKNVKLMMKTSIQTSTTIVNNPKKSAAKTDKEQLMEELRITNDRISNVTQDIQDLRQSVLESNKKNQRSEEQNECHSLSELKKSNFQSVTSISNKGGVTDVSSFYLSTSQIPDKLSSQNKSRDSSQNYESQYRDDFVIQETPRQNMDPTYAAKKQAPECATNYKRTFVKNENCEYEQYDDEINPRNNYKAIRDPKCEEWTRINQVPDFVKPILEKAKQGSAINQNSTLRQSSLDMDKSLRIQETKYLPTRSIKPTSSIYTSNYTPNNDYVTENQGQKQISTSTYFSEFRSHS